MSEFSAMPPAHAAAMRAAVETMLPVLDRGEAPAYAETLHPDGPTPIYDELSHPDRVGVRSLGLQRLPIPARPLSYQARARRTDPETSHQAAASVTTFSETHGRIIRLLDLFDSPHAGKEHHGLTDEELRFWWDNQYLPEHPITDSGLRSRRHELVQKGRVVAADEKGRTAAGRACTIWRLADA